MTLGARRQLTRLFIATWLAVQLLVPFLQKFELPSLRYRYARFSWAMFSRPGIVYTVDLVHRRPDGQEEPVPSVEQYTRDWGAAAGEPRQEAYGSVEEIEDWYTGLVRHIAARNEGSGEYVARIHWIASERPELPLDWELGVRAGGGS